MPPPTFEQQYRVVKDIGRGSSGTVHLVVDRKTNVRYVVKKVSLLGADEKTKSRVQSEIKALSTIDHPNVVQFRQSFTAPQDVSIVMEKCERSLADVISTACADRCTLNAGVIVEWMTELLCALQHVHSKKILHRDIKTSNIFLSAKNHVKLGDFGVCKIQAPDESRVVGKTVIGTPYYLAPEVLDGETYDERSDVWSLGVVFYEMCTLTLPFEGDNILALTTSISSGVFKQLPSYLDQRFTTVISSMLKVDPAERTTIQQIFETRFVLPKSHPSHPSHDPDVGRAIQRENGPSEIFTKSASHHIAGKPSDKGTRAAAPSAALVAQAQVKASPSKFAPIPANQAQRPAVVSMAAVLAVHPSMDDTATEPGSLSGTGVSSLTNSTHSAVGGGGGGGNGSVATKDTATTAPTSTTQTTNKDDRLSRVPQSSTDRSMPGSDSFVSPTVASPTGGAVKSSSEQARRGSPLPAAPKRRFTAEIASPPPSRPAEVVRAAAGGSAVMTRLSEEEHRQSLSRIRNAGSKINIAQLRKAMKSRSADRPDDDVTFIAVPSPGHTPMGGAQHQSSGFQQSPQKADHAAHRPAPQTPPRGHVDATSFDAVSAASNSPAQPRSSVAEQIRALLLQERARLTVGDMDDIAEVINAFKTSEFGLY